MITETENEATLDWQELCRIEYRLISLENMVVRLAKTEAKADYWRTYETWKRHLQLIAGWGADREVLRNEAAYNVAHDHLFALYAAKRTGGQR